MSYETEEKRVTPCDTKGKSQSIQNPDVLVSNSEVGRDGPQTRSLVEIENKSQKINKSAADAARNADARHETKLIKGIATLSRLGQRRSCLEIRGPSKPEDGGVDKKINPPSLAARIQQR